MAVQPIPAGYHTATIYITVKGAATSAQATVAGTVTSASGAPAPRQQVSLKVGTRTYVVNADAHGRFGFHVAALPKFSGPKDEARFLDEVAGRQLLHVTFGSVLTDATLKPRIIETLQRHAALHEELLDRHFTKHLSLLTEG